MELRVYKTLTRQLGKDTFEQICDIEDACRIFNNIVAVYAYTQDVGYYNLDRYRYLLPFLENIPDFLLRNILDSDSNLIYSKDDTFPLRFLASQAQPSRRGSLGYGFVLPGKSKPICEAGKMHEHVKDLFFPLPIPEGKWDTITVTLARAEKRASLVWEGKQDG